MTVAAFSFAIVLDLEDQAAIHGRTFQCA